MNISGDNEHGNILILYIKHYIYGITQKLCTHFPAIHCWADWQNEMFIEKKKVWQQFDRTIAHEFTNLWGCMF